MRSNKKCIENGEDSVTMPAGTKRTTLDHVSVTMYYGYYVERQDTELGSKTYALSLDKKERVTVHL
jgi:hypothetical protein